MHSLVFDGVYVAEGAFARPVFQEADPLEDAGMGSLAGPFRRPIRSEAYCTVTSSPLLQATGAGPGQVCESKKT